MTGARFIIFQSLDYNTKRDVEAILFPREDDADEAQDRFYKTMLNLSGRLIKGRGSLMF